MWHPGEAYLTLALQADKCNSTHRSGIGQHKDNIRLSVRSVYARLSSFSARFLLKSLAGNVRPRRRNDLRKLQRRNVRASATTSSTGNI